MANIKMEERKTIRVLKKLQKSELQKIAKLLGHGYFKTSESVILLFSFLSKHYPGFSNEKCNIESAIKFFSRKAKKEISTKQLNNLFAKLFSLIELFLRIEQLQKDKVLAVQILTQSYNQRGLYNQFKSSTEYLDVLLDKIDEKDSSFYNQKANLNENLYFHPHSEVLNIGAENLMLSDKNRTLAFIIKKLQYVCELLQSRRIKKTGYDFEISNLTEILQIAKKYSSNPIVKMYLDVIHLIKEGFDFQNMEKLIEDFSKNCILLKKRERLGLMTFLQNELIYQEIKGNTDNVLRLEIFKIGEIQNCLIFNNTISPRLFINICLASTRAGDNSYSQKFITLNSKYLPVEIRKYIVNFCKGDLLFFQNKFEKSFQLFNDNYNGSPNYLKHRIKGMMLLCEYEIFLNDFSYDETLRNSLENYIRNFQTDRQTNLLDNKKIIYLALGKFTQKLFNEKIRFLNGTTNQHIIQRTKDELLNELSSKNGIAAKWWLIQKINQL